MGTAAQLASSAQACANVWGIVKVCIVCEFAAQGKQKSISRQDSRCGTAGKIIDSDKGMPTAKQHGLPSGLFKNASFEDSQWLYMA